MKKLESELNIQDVENSVNYFFDTERYQGLVATMLAVDTEMILAEHLCRAFQILDSQTPFSVN